MRRELVRLCNKEEIEPKVVSILLANEFVTLDSKAKGLKFTNCNITQKGKKALNKKTIKVPDDWLDKFRDLFPDHRRSSPKAIRSKMDRFFMDYGTYDLEDIHRAAELYMEHLDDPRYCVGADNFFYKFNSDKTVRSTCLQYLELAEKEEDRGDKPDLSGDLML